MKSIKQIFIALALLCITPGITQVMAEPIAGKDYTVVNPAQSTNSGKKIEVLEALVDKVRKERAGTR